MTQIFRPASDSRSSSTPIHWSWITLTGADARDFLQRLTTVNTKTLQPNQGTEGCFLNAQGKIQAYFNLWNTGPDSYAFELDSGKEDHWKQALLKVIALYTFGEKMTLTDRSSELQSTWIFLSEDEASKFENQFQLKSKTTSFLPDEKIQISHHGTQSFGRAWISLWGPKASLEAWVQKNLPHSTPVSFQEIQKWRIENLAPWVDHEITDASLPLEVGLRQAVADNKGCYPGQEVIEKILALGSPPRRIALIHGNGTAPTPGSGITPLDSASEIGKITSSASESPKSDNAFIALGIIRKTHAKEGLEVQFPQGGAPSAQGKIIKVPAYQEQADQK